MKLICFILSLYVIVIALLPCNDIDACAKEAYACSSSQNNNSQEHEEQPCSPFCSCSCCSSIAYILSVPFSFSNDFEFKNEQSIALSTTVFCKDFINTIWQPPKQSC